MKKYDSLQILCSNGWDWDQYGDTIDDYYVYTSQFLGMYTTKVRAIVSGNSNHLKHDGHYGVLWLETDSYECGDHYSITELKDMMFALDLAEQNLLTIGMPFTPDYQFQSNRGNRKRRNEKLRKMYDLAEKEREEDK